MSKMSRRKQSKPQHISNGSDDEKKNLEVDDKREPASDVNELNGVTESHSDHTDSTDKVRLTRKRAKQKKLKQERATTSRNTECESDADESDQAEAPEPVAIVEPQEIIPPPRHIEQKPMPSNHPKLRDRTCEYCGAVKPTPAALQRHLRKHTGERPFVCQGCNKAYKAKRSLQLHQLTYHPELVNKPAQPGVSLGTSSLLREALESKLKLELSKYSGQTPDGKPEDFLEPGNSNLSTSNTSRQPGTVSKLEGENSVMVGTLSAEGTDIHPSQNASSHVNGEDTDEVEETEDQLSNRTCSFCGKVCFKPSDLKRHVLLHTGERPFKCDTCGKAFKAKGSLMYHQKSSHNVDIELSHSLEERYLRLKSRALMKSLYVQDRLMQHERVLAAAQIKQELDELEELDDLDSDPGDSRFYRMSYLNSDGPQHPRYQGEMRQGIDRQFSNTSDGSLTEENYVFGNSHGDVGDDIGSVITEEGPFTRTRIRIKNETVLVTRLDGVSLSSGKDRSVFKCYICGRMFSSLSRVQTHLSMHFEVETKKYECKFCDATFKFRTQMLQHVLKHRIKEQEGDEPVNDMDIDKDECVEEKNEVIHQDPLETPEAAAVSCEDSKMDTTESKESSPDLETIKSAKRLNGCHECKFCRKTFSRQFLLQRHERIHTGQKAFYCKECGKGFSESLNLRQHMIRFHGESMQYGYGQRGQKGVLRSKYKSLMRIAYWDRFPERTRPEVSDTSEMETAPEVTVPKKRDDDQRKRDLEKAKEFLEQEGIQDEVTVVMPSDPPVDTKNESVSDTQQSNHASESASESADTEDGQGSEIMNAPKRSLISFRKEGQPLKSRRKSTQPVKIENKLPKTSSPSPVSVPPASTSAVASTSALASTDTSPEQAKTNTSSDSSIPPTSLMSNDAEMAAAAAVYSTAAAMASLNPLLLANTVAVTSSSCLLPGARLIPGLPAAGLAINPVMSMPISVQVPLDPHGVIKTPSPSLSSSSQPSPADPDSLVGFPRVQWNPSPTDNNSGPSSSERRKSLPLWHPLSNLDLKNSISADGRKVTSLSRTHSRKFSARLHVVNQPVDRDQACKPTVLPDGRTVYRCMFCMKDFLSFSDINRHMDFHEDIRPYKCKYCDYYARTNSQLKVHMMRHQGIREFCCKLCNYKGVTQSDLNRHMKSQIHMLKARNECQHCGEGFVTPKNLEKHMDGNCVIKVHELNGSVIME